MTTRLAGFLLVFSLSVANSGYAAETEQELLEMIRVRHSATLERVESVSCEVKLVESSDALKQTVYGHYWRSPGLIRVQEHHDDGDVENLLVKDSQILSLTERNDPAGSGKQFVAGRRPTSDAFCRLDVWARMLLNFPGKQAERLSLPEFLRLNDGNIKHVQRTRDGNKDLLHVQLTYKNNLPQPTNCEIWFDPEVGYLVNKMILTSETIVADQLTKYQSTFEIKQWDEVSAGLFFPTQCAVYVSYAEKQVAEMWTSLTQLAVNKPIPTEIFSLAIPAGTLMIDKLQACSYHVDASGRRLDQGESFNIEPAVSPSTKIISPITPEENKQSVPAAVRPQRYGKMIFVFGVGAGAAAICIFAAARRRRRGLGGANIAGEQSSAHGGA